MTALQLKIIQKAVAIRVANGEDIDQVLDAYAKLSNEERKQIKENLGL